MFIVSLRFSVVNAWTHNLGLTTVRKDFDSRNSLVASTNCIAMRMHKNCLDNNFYANRLDEYKVDLLDHAIPLS